MSHKAATVGDMIRIVNDLMSRGLCIVDEKEVSTMAYIRDRFCMHAGIKEELSIKEFLELEVKMRETCPMIDAIRDYEVKIGSDNVIVTAIPRIIYNEDAFARAPELIAVMKLKTLEIK